MRNLVCAGFVAVMFVGASAALAADDLNAFRTLSGSEVSFSLGGAYSNATLTIVGPDGFTAKDYSRTGSPAIDLIKAKAKADGVYNYEITAATSDTVPIAGDENNGRGGADKGTMKRGISASGSFLVKGGLVVDTSDETESAK